MPEDEMSFGVLFCFFDYEMQEVSSLFHLLSSWSVEMLASLRKFLIPSFNSLVPRNVFLHTQFYSYDQTMWVLNTSLARHLAFHFYPIN